MNDEIKGFLKKYKTAAIVVAVVILLVLSSFAQAIEPPIRGAVLQDGDYVYACFLPTEVNGKMTTLCARVHKSQFMQCTPQNPNKGNLTCESI